MSDPWKEFLEDPANQEWLENVRTKLIPMIRGSHAGVSLVPEDPTELDIKFAIELGFMIMLDKPILAVVQPGTKVPNKLVRVADRIVEWTHGTLVAQQIAEFIKEVKGDET